MAMELRNILIFFCFIFHEINTQNRIGSDYTPGDAMPLQKPILGDADDQSNDKERTSAKLDADDKRENKERTSAKVDADDRSDEKERS